MNKAIKILIVPIIVILISLIIVIWFDLGPLWGITQEDIDRELSRWWVIYYKMLEDDISGQTNDFAVKVDETLKQEFNPKGEHFSEHYNSASIKDKYRLVKRRNELMEEALIKFKGEEALKEIEGIWSLDEIPNLWEKVNSQNY